MDHLVQTQFKLKISKQKALKNCFMFFLVELLFSWKVMFTIQNCRLTHQETVLHKYKHVEKAVIICLFFVLNTDNWGRGRSSQTNTILAGNFETKSCVQLFDVSFEFIYFFYWNTCICHSKLQVESSRNSFAMTDTVIVRESSEELFIPLFWMKVNPLATI